MAEEVDCRPRRLFVKTHRSLPEAIKKILEDTTGIPVLQYTGKCSKDDILIYSPLTRRPQGECLKIRVPHLTLLVPLLRKASSDWCSFINDPETFYHRFLLEESIRIYEDFEPAWTGTPVLPRHPPPILIASEIYVHSMEIFRRELKRRTSQGADIVVVGADKYTNRQDYISAVREATVDHIVFVDPMGLITPQEAYHYGATGWMSITPCEMEAVDESIREDLAFVIIPRRLSSAHERYNELKTAIKTGESLGFKKMILDPVLQPAISPGVMEGFYAALLLRRDGFGPLMLGINNVFELLDADTSGSIGLLVSLAAESGSSLVLVSEESAKSRGATIEAVVASRMASLALYYGSPPKDFPFRLFMVKEKGRDLVI
ncbi:MAG: hypothetical protein F7B19_01910 [Desulfurococcales archaeon]|nr:hypothetical protein [Desulfurococcales archaeon]